MKTESFFFVLDAVLQLIEIGLLGAVYFSLRATLNSVSDAIDASLMVDRSEDWRRGIFVQKPAAEQQNVAAQPGA